MWKNLVSSFLTNISEGDYRNTLTVVAGALGTDKTLLASHWIAEGARNDETCVYISSRMSITTIVGSSLIPSSNLH
ncbi:hypothetical protein DRP07_09355 [Archaeoglobales archaeon]|nr:MAG: hypothetical protein DRP07_09355 [Archaeoglobales archaeon]